MSEASRRRDHARGLGFGPKATQRKHLPGKDNDATSITSHGRHASNGRPRQVRLSRKDALILALTALFCIAVIAYLVYLLVRN